jgi:hypothetical protein
MSDNTLPPEEPTAPEPTVDDLLNVHKMRRTIKDLKTRNRDLLEQVEIARERAEVACVLQQEPEQLVDPIVRRETRSGLREATAVVIASDWHIEESVRPETVAGRNQYNLLTARARARRFFSGIIWLLSFHSDGFQIKDMILGLLGDLISGYIHEELVEENEMSPTEATLMVQELITEGLRRLLAETELERIIVPCCYGNHGRTTQKRRVQSAAKNSFEWMMYHTLAQRFANEPRVEFVIADGSHLYLNTYEWTHRFHHGDDIRYYGGVGGVHIPLRKAVANWETFRRAEYTWIGHFHQFIPDTWGCCVNGSLIGYNAYALSIKATFEQPKQAFALIDSKHGKCQMTPIWVHASERDGASAGAMHVRPDRASQPSRDLGPAVDPETGKTVHELAAESGLAYRTVLSRLRRGKTGADLVCPPDERMRRLSARAVQKKQDNDLTAPAASPTAGLKNSQE